MGGAARYAYDNFGAEWGNGVGPQGQCYAIPTMHGPLSDIKPYVDDFIEYARQHPMNRFLLTRIGCGIAGFKDKDMVKSFWTTLWGKRQNLDFMQCVLKGISISMEKADSHLQENSASAIMDYRRMRIHHFSCARN